MSEEVTPDPIQNDAASAADAAVEDTALAAAVAGEGDAAVAAAEADKTEDTAPVSALIGAPEDYDASAFTMPDGVEFDSEMFDLIKDDLKGLDLSQEGAGKIVGLFAEKVAPKIAERTEARMTELGQEISAQFARDLQADPVVGGVKLKEAQAYAAKAITAAIPDAAARAEFSKFLNESGMGNHPLLMRVIAAGGRAMGEATTPAGGVVAEKSVTERFYGRS
jgi:hypothetical protein